MHITISEKTHRSCGQRLSRNLRLLRSMEKKMNRRQKKRCEYNRRILNSRQRRQRTRMTPAPKWADNATSIALDGDRLYSADDGDSTSDYGLRWSRRTHTQKGCSVEKFATLWTMDVRKECEKFGCVRTLKAADKWTSVEARFVTRTQ